MTAKKNTEEKKATGRPRLFKTPQEMAAKAEAYFKECDEGKKPYTVAGLAYALGFSARTSFSDYGTDHASFSDTVKRLRLRIEAQKCEWLNTKEKFTPGLIFDLKNNFDYRESQDLTFQGEPLSFVLNFTKPGGEE